MAIPERIKPTKLDDYLEVITNAVFQNGLKWSLIESKWPAFRKAFKNFDAHKVAAFKPADIQRVSTDETIIRSPKKVEATVKNARALVELEKKHGSIHNYFKSFDGYESLAKDIRKRFSFMGDMSVYYFLFRVGEEVPDFESWIVTIPGDHPRMKEMVELARKQDAL